jgi:hypothetical protein
MCTTYPFPALRTYGVCDAYLEVQIAYTDRLSECRVTFPLSMRWLLAPIPANLPAGRQALNHNRSASRHDQVTGSIAPIPAAIRAREPDNDIPRHSRCSQTQQDSRRDVSFAG